MSGVMRALVGKRVAIFTVSQSGYKDEGVVREVDELAIRLEVGDPNRPERSTTYVFPLANVRLIRVLD